MLGPMANTYRTADAASQDKELLVELLDALNTSPSTLRRDEAGLWILRGSRGYCCTWGDDRTWQLVVTPEEELSKQARTWIKKRLAFCELTQDGDSEGCFRLHRLPAAAEAEEIRDILGIWKRVEYAPEELADGRRLIGA
jgi:hypothetical protein